MEDQLKARRQSAENTFAALVEQKKQKQAEMDELDAEMNRLQGEWRLVNDLLIKPKKKAKVSKEAGKLDVTGVEGA